ncbi:MAG: hypothetical protein ACFFD1_14760 [Candidatus Thorarchaeota archaeon]
MNNELIIKIIGELKPIIIIIIIWSLVFASYVILKVLMNFVDKKNKRGIDNAL